MSLLPPSLSTPAPAPVPAPTGNASSASSSRRGESSQDDAESFSDALSRSLAASGEPSAKTGGKPAPSVPLKRVADEKKADAQEPVNTAALLFIPLETLIAKTASSDTGRPAATGGAIITASAVATAAPAEQPAEQTAPAGAATAAANDAVLSADTDAGTQAPQTLLASGMAAAPAKERGLASAPTPPSPAGDEAAIALPADKIAAPAKAPDAGHTGQFAGRDDQPGDEAQSIAGTDTRVPQKTAAAKTSAVTAANDATDKTAVGAISASAPAAAGQRPEAEAPAADSAITVSAPIATVHGTAAASSPVAPPATSQAALTPEVGSSEWGKALGQQMVHMGKAGEHVAELQLNPPGLGPLKVTLSMNDNQVQALFVSAHSSVRAAVEAALPQLRTTLADSGISLGNTSVNSGSQQQPAFAQNQNGQPGQSGQRSQQAYRPADAGALAPPLAVAPPPRRGNSIGVDTYA